MPIDYSKWKNIEVSDDEDDTHPNIDTPSLFRWRHQARLERMAEQKIEKEELEKKKGTTSSKIEDLNKKLADSSLSEEEKKAAEAEIAEIKKQEEDFRKKEAELEEKERLQPWNVDTIGTVKIDKTRITKVGEKKPETKNISDEEDSKRMYKYFDEHESKLKVFSRLEGLDKTEEYMLEYPLLASEYAVNWITIEALNLAIEDKNDKEMCVVAEQNTVLQYLLELAKSLKAEPTNTNMIKNFFKKFKAADPQYMKHFHDEVASFQNRLRLRAKQKRDDALAEYEAEEKQKRIAEAPGGLDPQEVFETLPVEMREAFESREISRLQDIAANMDEEVFSYHLKRCIDSGLWVPNVNAGEDDDDEEVDEVQPSTSNG
ncbi:cdc-37 [Pristionchus pacificus]|uniref:Hsp90 chaperone protein kinase-targeting subunit n=1 Tax=Pristionchus pacificus TaxID=54126 RepID=A0A2A6D3N9_PRIPA|nr:cdc-37 [Pristionchus pacificus]|eukprot:PDM84930.1 cdc-37 [Pristionchus pacificus]